MGRLKLLENEAAGTFCPLYTEPIVDERRLVVCIPVKASFESANGP